VTEFSLTLKLLNGTARTKDIADIGKMPSSCSDLERMGHQINGFFSVKGSKKMETVYCDFYSNVTGTDIVHNTIYVSLTNFFFQNYYSKAKMDWLL
jgi:hypothetical protein